MSSTTQMLLGLAVAIVFMVILLVKSRLNPFITLIMAALLTGILGGMPANEVVNAVKTGFGNTLSSLGILILFGVMIGKVLEVSGATEALGTTFIKIAGKGHEIIAMVFTGFVISLAIFCVPAFIMLFPLAKEISKKSHISINALGIALAGGLLWSHTLVPPAVGPIGGAAIYNANIAQMMLFGFLIGIPMAMFLVYYSKWIGKKYPAEATVVSDDNENKNLPSAKISILPILVPVVLILLDNVTNQFKLSFPGRNILSLLGNPVIAMGIGLLISIYTLLGKVDKKQVRSALEDGIKGGSNIFILIAAGGALGNVVNQSGVGKILAEAVSKTSIPAILIPFVIATLLRLIQGSGSVAILTTASITAPIIATLHVSPVLATLAACVGSMFFSYYNDSYFWTINEAIGSKDTRQQLLTWSVPTTVCWALGGVTLFILSFIIK